jgi:fibronectin-binding autotransporter adhesin
VIQIHRPGIRSKSVFRAEPARLLVLAAAIAAVGILPPAASAQNGTWTQVGGSPASWGTSANWAGGTIANGQDNTATFATAGLTGPFTVTLDQNRTIGNLVFANPTNAFPWTIDQGVAPFTLTLQTSGATAPNIAVNNAFLTAVLNVALFDNGVQGFTKSGLGTLSLTINGGYGGPTVVNGGTLTTDYSAGVSSGSNIVPTTSAVTLANGGSFNIIVGASQGVSQSLNGLTLNPGAANFSATLGTGATLSTSLGAITRSSGAVLSFNLPAAGATTSTFSTNTAGTILGGWATIFTPPTSGTAGITNGWATATAGNIVPLAAASYTAGGAWAAANNTDETINGTVTVASGSTTNSVRFNNGGGTNYVTSLAGGTNTILSGGILVTQGVGGGATTTISGPGLLTSGNGTDLIVTNNNVFSPFTISAGITGPIGLTTAGAGTTALSGTNNYTGSTIVGAGTLLASTTAAVPGFNSPGMISVLGGTLTVNTAGWSSANIDILLANATFNRGAALGLDVPAAATFTYASNVSGALGLTKNDSGTLTLTGSSTFTGDTTINGGVLIAASIANSGTASAVGAGNNLGLGTGGTFQYTGGSASVNRGITLNYNGGTINVATAGTNLSLSGLVSGLGGLTKTGPGTLTITGTGTYAGPTVVSAGTLAFNGANSLPALNDLTIAPGATASIGAAAAPVIGALSGGGTLNLGSATTLSLGSDIASGSFQGSIVAPAGLAVTKVGSGLQGLIGGNIYTGGTTVSAGTLLLSPQAPGANPLGTGPLNITGTGVTVAYRQLLPIPTSGYNHDEIWGANEGATPNPSQQVTQGFDFVNSQIFYPAGVPNSPGGGLPANRVVNSLVGGGSTFIYQPYNANNVLFLLPGQSGTLSLINQGSFKSLNLLVAGTNGSTGIPTGVTLNYSDGSSTTTSVSVLDWFNGTTNVAIQGLGRFTFTSETFDTGAGTLGSNNPRMYQVGITLSAADQAKTLTSLTIQNNGTGAQADGVFALNGTSVGSPANLTPGNAVNISVDTTLEVTGYSSVAFGALTVGTNNVTVNGSAASAMTFTGTTLTGTPTFTVTAGVAVALGTITDANSGFGFTKAGAGTLTITGGTNYFGGLVAINGGVLDVGSPTALPLYTTPGEVTLVSGATLAVGFGGAGQWTAAQIGTPSTPGTLLGTVTFPAGSAFGLDVATGPPATLTTAGGFSLPAGVGFVKLGGGTLVMNGVNTYTGATTILGGELATDTLASGGSGSGIGTSSNVAGNLVFANGALLQYTGPSVTIDRGYTLNTNTGFGTAVGGGFDIPTAGTSLTITGAGTGAGMLTKTGAGTLILTGANNYTGGTTIAAGILQIGAGGATGALGTGAVVDNGALVYNLTAAATVSNVISGTGGITKLGTSSLTLSGANTYTGPTTVSTGSLLAGNASAFGTNSAVTLPTGATLSLNGNSVAIGSLTGTGGTVNDNTTANATLTVGGDNTSTTYGGTIVNGSTGTLALSKTGIGTLTLTGTDTYTGGTTVSNGTLGVASDGALGTGAVTIAPLGTLSYTATTSTTKSFSLNLGTLAVAGGATLTLNGGSVVGGFLRGAGIFATSPVTGAQFAADTTQPAVTIASNSGLDRFVNFTNGGTLNVAAGLAAPVTFSGFTNQGSGSITVGAVSKVNASDFQSYGQVTLNPAVVGSGQFTEFTNTGTSPLYFNGGSRTFLGTPATAGPPSAPNFVAGIDLHGQNAIVAGGLFVNNGFVVDSTNSGTGTATIVADFGALVKGAGFFQNTIITQNGGKVQAGNSPGSASFGSFVFGPGGVSNYVFAIDDATGAAGPSPDAQGHVSGWGLINAVKQSFGSATASGNFIWTATPSSKLTVSLDTLVNPTTVGTDVAGLMADFDPSQAYSWPAAKWAGTYSGPTDVAMMDAATSFDTSGFLNPVTGTFGWSLDPAGQTLSLTYTPSAVPEPGTLTLVGCAAAGLASWRRRGQLPPRSFTGPA